MLSLSLVGATDIPRLVHPQTQISCETLGDISEPRIFCVEASRCWGLTKYEIPPDLAHNLADPSSFPALALAISLKGSVSATILHVLVDVIACLAWPALSPDLGHILGGADWSSPDSSQHWLLQVSVTYVVQLAQLSRKLVGVAVSHIPYRKCPDPVLSHSDEFVGQLHVALPCPSTLRCMLRTISAGYAPSYPTKASFGI